MLAFLALNAGAALLALRLALVLGFGGRSSGLLLATLAGFLVCVHGVVLVAGVAGHLTLAGTAVVLGVALAGALASRPGPPPDRGAAGRRRFTTAALFAPAAAIVAAGVWTWPHLLAGTRLWVWDDYTYHMVYPALWLQERTIAAATPAQSFTTQAWFPLSASLVSTWFMIPFPRGRGEMLAWVSLTGVLYAGLVAAGVRELFGRLGSAPGAWAVPLVLFATSPRIATMASSFSDADLANAAAMFAAFVFAVPRGPDERPRDIVVDAWYAAVLTGIAVGVKVSAAPAALIVLVMASARGARATPACVRTVARAVFAFALGWAGTCGYWYARNLLHTGNPVYPAAFVVWPGVTFPESTLVEYARHYGLSRTLADALHVYLNWPLHYALLALGGLAGLAGWLAVRRRSLSWPCRAFAAGTLAIVLVTLVLLPTTPYSAGNALTFRSGLVHWDSMRYVALLAILGWTALGFLVDAGAGAPRWRIVAAVVIASAALLRVEAPIPGVVLLALALGTTILARACMPLVAPALATARAHVAAIAIGMLALGAIVAGAHRVKAAATETAFHREPRFGAAAAVLDAQPPGTRVALFGDQWNYPAFGDRLHLRPVRLDRDGRIATTLIGDAMDPGELTVDPGTFRANLGASGVDVVVLVRQPHPGRPYELPGQHAALRAGGAARLLYADRAVAIWRLRD